MEVSQYRVQQGHAADLRQHRRLPVGADVLPSGGVHFRVWASRHQHVEVVLEGGPGYHPGAEPVSVALEPEGDGYFSGLVPEADAGTHYRYRLDGGTASYPDVASQRSSLEAASFREQRKRRLASTGPIPHAASGSRNLLYRLHINC